MKVYDQTFSEIAQPIIEHEEYQKLKEFKHHDESAYEHSLRVAYSAYDIARKMNLDVESVVRGALLHDFYLYQFEKKKSLRLITDSIKHAANHPKYAKENAEKYFNLNKKEENIIEGHMFPFGLPRSTEAWVVTYCDKCIASMEYGSNLKKIIKRKYRAMIAQN